MGSEVSNTYFDKSLFIDSEGYIKGSFVDGSTNKDRLAVHTDEWIDNKLNLYSLKNNESFNKLWSASLSKVEICKDCEFRNICIDCRKPFLNHTHWNKDTCSYNPFISKWENERGYVSSSDCGHYSVTGEFIKDLPYIRKLNQIFWN